MKKLQRIIMVVLSLLPGFACAQLQFTCDGRAYQAIGSPTHLYQFDFVTNSYQDLGVLNEDFDLRAVGLSPVDSFAYAIDDSSKLLVQFGTDAQDGAFGLFTLSGAYLDSINNNSVVAADFSPDGALCIMTSGANNIVYKVDVMNKAVNELFYTNEAFDKADMIWDPIDSAFYSIGSPGSSEGPQFLYKFPAGANGDTVPVEKVPISIPGGDAFTYIGALFIDQDNRLLGHLNNNGNVYTIDRTTGAVTFAIATNIIGIYNDGFACTPIAFPIPLPLTLLSFEAVPDSEGYFLKWVTASETASSHFEVEYATDGTDFTFIDKVTAAGFSKERITYRYRIPGSVLQRAEKLLFRLKMVDKDNTFIYSRIVEAEGRKGSGAIRLYPTVASAGSPVYLVADGYKEAVIYNTGDPGMQQKVRLSGGTLQIPTSGWPAGVYVVKVGNEAIKFVLR